MKQFNTELYFITDSSGYSEEEFLYRVEQALLGGVAMLQLREKEKSTKEYIELAEKVHKITKQYGIPLIIDDRIDVMQAVGAEGVHLGQMDMSVSTARSILGTDIIIGATAKTVPWAQDVASQGADYLGVGAIFPTTTKVKTVLTSTETLQAICDAVSIPVNAIGGLTVDNMDVLQGIPISGICAVSAIMKAQSPKRAAEQMRDKFKRMQMK